MLKGQLWATSDIMMARQSVANGFRVIYLGDPMAIDPADKEVFVTATSLVPDYQAMSILVDGNEEAFVGMYAASLNTKPAVDMLSLIFACLYKGIGIMLYIPQEAVSLNYISYLLQFIEYNYGIIAQTKSTAFSFNPKFMSKIMALLYLSNLVTAAEFLINSDDLDDMTLKKLVNEYHPMVENPKDIKQIIEWFSNFKDQLIKFNKPLINGIQYAGEVSDYGCFY